MCLQGLRFWWRHSWHCGGNPRLHILQWTGLSFYPMYRESHNPILPESGAIFYILGNLNEMCDWYIGLPIICERYRVNINEWLAAQCARTTCVIASIKETSFLWNSITTVRYLPIEIRLVNRWNVHVCRKWHARNQCIYQTSIPIDLLPQTHQNDSWIMLSKAAPVSHGYKVNDFLLT